MKDMSNGNAALENGGGVLHTILIVCPKLADTRLADTLVFVITLFGAIMKATSDSSKRRPETDFVVFIHSPY